MVKDEDDAVGRAQVSAWRSLAGSVSDQRTALVAAKADLVAAWPPEQNASAAAFVTELDTLIARLDTAAADAETTATGLDRIMNALQSAKQEIEPLWEQYKDKSDDLVPRWFDSAEDELDAQARQAMITAETAVQDSVAMLRVPEPYRLEPPVIEDDPRGLPTGDDSGSTSAGSGGGGSGSGLSVPVPHDPVPPLPGRDPILADTGGALPGGVLPGGALSGGGALPGGGAVIGGGGPDLAGVITPPPPPTTLPGLGGAGPLPGGGVPLPSGGGGLNPIVPAVLPAGPPLLPGGLPPGGRGLRPSTSGGVIGDRSALGRAGLGEAGGAAGARPASGPIGGVPGGRPPGGSAGGPIGSPPGGPIGGTGQPGGRPTTRGRIGAGGVIGRNGEAPHGTLPAGDNTQAHGTSAARGTTLAPRPSWLPNDPVGPDRHAMTPGQAAGMHGRRADGAQLAFDPDSPWQVAEGVRPVIAPGPAEARHDPGPHVIGRHE
jgi:hypothetical protein